MQGILGRSLAGIQDFNSHDPLVCKHSVNPLPASEKQALARKSWHKEGMESVLPHVIASSEHAPGHAPSTPPFAQQTVVLTKQAYIELT